MKALESFVWLEVKDSCFKVSILKAHFSGKSKVLIWWMKIIKIGYHYLKISRTIYDTLKKHILLWSSLESQDMKMIFVNILSQIAISIFSIVW